MKFEGKTIKDYTYIDSFADDYELRQNKMTLRYSLIKTNFKGKMFISAQITETKEAILRMLDTNEIAWMPINDILKFMDMYQKPPTPLIQTRFI